MAHSVRHSCPPGAFAFHFLPWKSIPTFWTRSKPNNVFKGAHVDVVNLWSGNVEWLQIMNRYPLMPPSSSNMRGTLQSLCLSFSGLLAVCQSQGRFSGRRDPPDPRRAEAIRTNQLVGLGLKSWDFMTYMEILFLSSTWLALSTFFLCCSLANRNGSTGVAGPSPSDHWVTDGDARWTRPSNSHRGAV